MTTYFEDFLGFVETDVEERVAVDLDDLVADGEAAVAVDPAAGLDALDDEAAVVVARDDVDAEGTWKWKGKVSFNSVSRPLSPFASLVFLRATRVPQKRNYGRGKSDDN